MLTLFGRGWHKVLSIGQTNAFYVVTEKYPLECVFIDNFVSLNHKV